VPQLQGPQSQGLIDDMQPTEPAREMHAMSRSITIACIAGLALLVGCERTDTIQRGYRGLAQVQMYTPAVVAASTEINQIPEAEEPADAESPMVNEVFKNVKVLNDLSATEFSRLMQALSTWVAPVEGCDFCHNPKKLESDEKYPKIVARRMLQMTRDINTNWKQHVGSTGVTCWTCHRGQAVPSGDWFKHPGPHAAPNSQANFSGQNIRGAENAGNSALPYDPLSAFLTTGNEIRIQGTSPLADGNRQSIKQAKWTYSLMMYMSKSLGVNCTYCHNTRAMGRWEESTPQRATAWHGIRMVRELNTSYLIPLTPVFPTHRLSAEGDGPKVGCATCHKGTFKPLYGASSLKDYPVLEGIWTPPAAASAPAALQSNAGFDPDKKEVTAAK
jgi:Photosynthetic reaction centre cytochrome C subunit